jgi:hypothetical protein
VVGISLAAGSFCGIWDPKIGLQFDLLADRYFAESDAALLGETSFGAFGLELAEVANSSVIPCPCCFVAGMAVSGM